MRGREGGEGEQTAPNVRMTSGREGCGVGVGVGDRVVGKSDTV